MPMSLYDITVPVYLHGLESLSQILARAEAWAQERKIEPSVLIQARLAPDMLPLSSQVQIACDAAKFGSARGADVTPPSFPDTEASFGELQARIAKTVEFLRTIRPEQMQDEDAPVTMKLRAGERRFTRRSYIQQLAVPNFYFHITTAYDILRHNGLELGKMDYLGKIGEPV